VCACAEFALERKEKEESRCRYGSRNKREGSHRESCIHELLSAPTSTVEPQVVRQLAATATATATARSKNTNYTLKLFPQPQVVSALGFEKPKPPPISSLLLMDYGSVRGHLKER